MKFYVKICKFAIAIEVQNSGRINYVNNDPDVYDLA